MAVDFQSQDIFSYNSAISACEKGSRLQETSRSHGSNVMSRFLPQEPTGDVTMTLGIRRNQPQMIHLVQYVRDDQHLFFWLAGNLNDCVTVAVGLDDGRDM